MSKLLTLFAFCASTFGFAQQVSAQTSRMELAVQAGPGLSWLRGNTFLDGTDAQFNAAYGIGFQYNFNKGIGLRTGVSYQRKGSSAEITLTDINGSTLAKGAALNTLEYLVVPVMVRAGFGQSVRFFANVGPYAGYLLKGTSRIKDVEGFDDDTTEGLEQWDLGVCAGLGVDMNAGARLQLSAELRQAMGLVNVSKLPLVDDGSILTRGTTLFLGIGYRLGKEL